jgi:hypothetical protein
VPIAVDPTVQLDTKLLRDPPRTPAIGTKVERCGNPVAYTTSTSYADLISIDLLPLNLPSLNGVIVLRARGYFDKFSTGVGYVRIVLVDSAGNVLVSSQEWSYSVSPNYLCLDEYTVWEGTLATARYAKLQFRTADTDRAYAYGCISGFCNAWPIALYVKAIPGVSLLK